MVVDKFMLKKCLVSVEIDSDNLTLIGYDKKNKWLWSFEAYIGSKKKEMLKDLKWLLKLGLRCARWTDIPEVQRIHKKYFGDK